MTDINWRGVAYCMIIGFLLIVGLGVAVAHAEPINMSVLSNFTGGSFVAVDTVADGNTLVHPAITPIPTNVPIGRKIEQGGCVVTGETIDIAGIGWFTGSLAYYGPYYNDYAEADNTSIVASVYPKAWDLDHYYLDPVFFNNHKGWWYSHYPTYERGYSRLFRVADTCALTPKENATAVKEAMNESAMLQMVAANLTTLPVKTDGTDMIISKFSTMSTDAPADSHRWIFGRVNYQYDTALPWVNTTSFENDYMRGWESGVYDAIFIKPGRNGILEERYNSYTKTITSPFRAQEDTILNGTQPRLAEVMLINKIAASYDDSYEMMKISIQDPSIEIKRLNQVTLANNHTAFTISGYTNANQGTELKLTLDSNITNDRTRNQNTKYATVVNNGGYAAYRAWNTSFIVDLTGVFPGPHSITATNAEGASATVPFYVYNELAKHYVPDARLEYIGNSPFIPPVIKIQKEIVTVTQQVPMPIPPSEAQINEAAQKIVEEQNHNRDRVIVWGLILILVFAFFGWGAWSLWRAKRK